MRPGGHGLCPSRSRYHQAFGRAPRTASHRCALEVAGFGHSKVGELLSSSKNTPAPTCALRVHPPAQSPVFLRNAAVAMLGLEGLQLTGPRIPLFMPARKKWFALPLFSRGRSRARLIRGRPRDLRVVHRFPLPLIHLFHSSTLRSALLLLSSIIVERRAQQGSVPGDLISSRKFVIAGGGSRAA